MLHPSICLTQDNMIHGKGLIATAAIHAGEVIWRRDRTLPPIKLAETLTWSAEAQADFAWFAFQISADEYLYSHTDDHYMNHSCDPNTWWADDETLVASRHIQPGEEVTYDYATTEINGDFSMSCRCGAAACRGKVTPHDHLSAQWQARYGDHLPSFVKESIQRHRAQQHAGE